MADRNLIERLREAVAREQAAHRRRGPVPPMPEAWHPLPGTEWEELDAGDDIETRERWWRTLWAEGRI